MIGPISLSNSNGNTSNLYRINVQCTTYLEIDSSNYEFHTKFSFLSSVNITTSAGLKSYLSTRSKPLSVDGYGQTSGYLKGYALLVELEHHYDQYFRLTALTGGYHLEPLLQTGDVSYADCTISSEAA